MSASILASVYSTLIAAGSYDTACQIDYYAELPALQADILSADAPLLCETRWGTVGFYPEGVYIGDYEGTVRSGHGVWIFYTPSHDPESRWTYWCEADFADDRPEGPFRDRMCVLDTEYSYVECREGVLTGGYYDGAVTLTQWDPAGFRYEYTMNYDRGVVLPFAEYPGSFYQYEVGRGDTFENGAEAQIGYCDDSGMWVGSSLYYSSETDITLPDGIWGFLP